MNSKLNQINQIKFNDNILKQNNINNNKEEQNVLKNEIICIYSKKESEINLLHDYNLHIEDDEEKNYMKKVRII